MTFKVGDLVAAPSFSVEWRGVVRAVDRYRITVFWFNNGSTHTVGDLLLCLLKEIS